MSTNASVRRQLRTILGPQIFRMKCSKGDAYDKSSLFTQLALDDKVVSSLKDLYVTLAECCPADQNGYEKDPAMGDLWYAARHYDMLDGGKKAALQSFLSVLLASKPFSFQKGSCRANRNQWTHLYKLTSNPGTFGERKPTRGGEEYYSQPKPSDTSMRHVREKQGDALIPSNLSGEQGKGELLSTAHPDAFMSNDSLPKEISIHDAMTDIANAEPTGEMKEVTKMQGHGVRTDQKLMRKRPTQHTSGYQTPYSYLPPVPSYSSPTEAKKSRDMAMIEAANSHMTTGRGNVTLPGQSMINVTSYMTTGQGTGGKTQMGGGPGTNFSKLSDNGGIVIPDEVRDEKENPNESKKSSEQGDNIEEKKNGPFTTPEGVTADELLNAVFSSDKKHGGQDAKDAKGSQGVTPSLIETGTGQVGGMIGRAAETISTPMGKLLRWMVVWDTMGQINKDMPIWLRTRHDKIKSAWQSVGQSKGWSEKFVSFMVAMSETVLGTAGATGEEVEKLIETTVKNMIPKSEEEENALKGISEKVAEGAKAQPLQGKGKKMTLQGIFDRRPPGTVDTNQETPDYATQKALWAEQQKNIIKSKTSDDEVNQWIRDHPDEVHDLGGADNVRAVFWDSQRVKGIHGTEGGEGETPLGNIPTSSQTSEDPASYSSSGVRGIVPYNQDDETSFVDLEQMMGPKSKQTAVKIKKPGDPVTVHPPPPPAQKRPADSSSSTSNVLQPLQPPPSPDTQSQQPAPKQPRTGKKGEHFAKIKGNIEYETLAMDGINLAVSELEKEYNNLKGTAPAAVQARSDIKKNIEGLRGQYHEHLESVKKSIGELKELRAQGKLYNIHAQEHRKKAKEWKNDKEARDAAYNEEVANVNRSTTDDERTKREKIRDIKKKYQDKEKIAEDNRQIANEQFRDERALWEAEVGEDAGPFEVFVSDLEAFGPTDKRTQLLRDYYQSLDVKQPQNKRQQQQQVPAPAGQGQAGATGPDLSKQGTSGIGAGASAAGVVQAVNTGQQGAGATSQPSQQQTSQVDTGKKDKQGNPLVQVQGPGQNSVTSQATDPNSQGGQVGKDQQLGGRIENTYTPTLRLFFQEGGANIVQQINDNPEAKRSNREVWWSFDAYDWEANDEDDNNLRTQNIMEEARRFYGELDMDSLMPQKAQQATQEQYNKMDKEVFRFPTYNQPDAYSLQLDTRGGAPLTPLSADETDLTFHNVYMDPWIEIPESSPWKRMTQIQGTQMSDAQMRDPEHFHPNDQFSDRYENAFIYSTDS